MIHPSKILQNYDARARKHLGQNFLVNVHSLQGIEDILPAGCRVLEIGPGLGAVTRVLLEKDFRVVVCEKDAEMVEILKKEFTDLKIIHDDFLQVEISDLKALGVVAVVGNLPFYITSDIIVRIMSDLTFIETALLGVQKEVAERIQLGQGNSLALFCRALGKAKIFSRIKKTSFYPVPGVDGAWVHWVRDHKVKDIEDFSLITRACFWGKRKTLKNSLLNNPHFIESARGQQFHSRLVSHLDDNNIKKFLERRADDLSFDEYLQLLDFFTSTDNQALN